MAARILVLLVGIGILAVACSLVILLSDGESGATTIEQVDITWSAALLIPTHVLTLSGRWETYLEFGPPQPVTDEDGNIIQVKANRLSDELIVIDPGVIDDAVAMGEQVPLDQIPDECAVCLKWSAETHKAWYTTEYADPESLVDANGWKCGILTEWTDMLGELLPNSRTARAIRTNPQLPLASRLRSRVYVGGGEIRINVDGTIKIGYFGEDAPAGYKILCGMDTNGDHYFWVVK